MPEDGSDGPRVANSDEQCKSDAGRHARSRKRTSEEHAGRGNGNPDNLAVSEARERPVIYRRNQYSLNKIRLLSFSAPCGCAELFY